MRLVRALLIADALVTGVVYVLGIRHLTASYYYLQQAPGGMRAIGAVYLLAGVLLLLARLGTRAAVTAHLVAVFVYLVYGAALALSYAHGGDPGAGPVHLVLIAAVHAGLATEAVRRREP